MEDNVLTGSEVFAGISQTKVKLSLLPISHGNAPVTRLSSAVNAMFDIFADDMTCFLSGKGSYISLFCLLKDFGECSGFKVNNDKTEALAFGDSSRWEGVSNKYTLRNVINILGIYFGGTGKERDDLNYRETLKSIKKSLNLWKWRGLSLLGGYR